MDTGHDQVPNWPKELGSGNMMLMEFKAKISQLKIDSEIGEKFSKSKLFPM